MKKAFFATVVVSSVLVLCSFSLEKLTFGVQSSVSEAIVAGESCGKVLKELYAQYEIDGVLDFSDASNLAKLENLDSLLSKIRNQDKDTDFYKEFNAGVLTGSSRSAKDSDVDEFIDDIRSVDLASIMVMQKELEGACLNVDTVSAVFTLRESRGAAKRKSEKENDYEDGQEAVRRLTKLLKDFFAEKKTK